MHRTGRGEPVEMHRAAASSGWRAHTVHPSATTIQRECRRPTYVPPLSLSYKRQARHLTVSSFSLSRSTETYMESVPPPLLPLLALPTDSPPNFPLSLSRQTPPKEGRSKVAPASTPTKTSQPTPSSNSVNPVKHRRPTSLERTSKPSF